MATYTACYHINLSIDIEADSYDEVMEKLENITNDEIFEGVVLEDCWPEFDYLLDENGYEI